jgi:hypothetical protein
MKRFIHFMLPFLFERNWHTGELEYSRTRLFYFSMGIGFILLSIFIIWYLQSPVSYIKNI